MIQNLITKFDAIETIRDQLFSILLSEKASQMALAVAATIDPALYDFKLYADRSNVMDEYQNDVSALLPIVSVSLENVQYPGGNPVNQQKASAVFTIDIFGFGISEDVPGGGHIAGDVVATRETHRVSKLIRNIIINPEYINLTLYGIVSKRWISSITYTSPDDQTSHSRKVAGARISLNFEFIETTDETVPETIESVDVVLCRSEDGEVYISPSFP